MFLALLSSKLLPSFLVTAFVKTSHFRESFRHDLPDCCLRFVLLGLLVCRCHLLGSEEVWVVDVSEEIFAAVFTLEYGAPVMECHPVHISRPGMS